MRRSKKLSVARATLLSELVKSDRGVPVSDRYPPARKLICYGLARWGEPGRLFATGDGYAEVASVVQTASLDRADLPQGPS